MSREVAVSHVITVSRDVTVLRDVAVSRDVTMSRDVTVSREVAVSHEVTTAICKELETSARSPGSRNTEARRPWTRTEPSAVTDREEHQGLRSRAKDTTQRDVCVQSSAAAHGNGPKARASAETAGGGGCCVSERFGATPLVTVCVCAFDKSHLTLIDKTPGLGPLNQWQRRDSIFRRR